MNQTIYFRKDVWDKFKDELGKSNLVNQLLATHYSLNPREVTVDDRPLREPDVYLLSPKVAKKHPEAVPAIPSVVRGADFVPKPPDPKNVVLPPIIKIQGKLGELVDKRPIPKEMQPKFCKEGHPIPYGRDRCLGKGCKYS